VVTFTDKVGSDVMAYGDVVVLTSTAIFLVFNDGAYWGTGVTDQFLREDDNVAVTTSTTQVTVTDVVE